MLFNHDECMACCSKQNEISLTLFHKFPAGVCDNIASFLVCSHCDVMVKRETEFEKKCRGQWNDCSKVELQLKFFTIYNEPPFNKSDLQKVKFQKLQDVIVRNADDDSKKVMVSFMKIAFWSFRTETIPYIDSKKEPKKIAKRHQNQYYPYYKKEYPDNILIKLILYEYILELVGGDIMYMELEDIHEYLDEIFE